MEPPRRNPITPLDVLTMATVLGLLAWVIGQHVLPARPHHLQTAVVRTLRTLMTSLEMYRAPGAGAPSR